MTKGIKEAVAESRRVLAPEGEEPYWRLGVYWDEDEDEVLTAVHTSESTRIRGERRILMLDHPTTEEAVEAAVQRERDAIAIQAEEERRRGGAHVRGL